MITVLVDDYSAITQDFYDSVINSLQLDQLKCTCGRTGCMSIHGYYKRHIYAEETSGILSVMRVKCAECSATHAILLSSIVPYSQISLSIQVSILKNINSSGTERNAVCDKNPDIDENNVKSIIRKFRLYWQEKIRSDQLIYYPIKALVKKCFSFYMTQFMQVRRACNQFFQITT